MDDILKHRHYANDEDIRETNEILRAAMSRRRSASGSGSGPGTFEEILKRHEARKAKRKPRVNPSLRRVVDGRVDDWRTRPKVKSKHSHVERAAQGRSSSQGRPWVARAAHQAALNRGQNESSRPTVSGSRPPSQRYALPHPSKPSRGPFPQPRDTSKAASGEFQRFVNQRPITPSERKKLEEQKAAWLHGSKQSEQRKPVPDGLKEKRKRKPEDVSPGERDGKRRKRTSTAEEQGSKVQHAEDQTLISQREAEKAIDGCENVWQKAGAVPPEGYESMSGAANVGEPVSAGSAESISPQEANSRIQSPRGDSYGQGEAEMKKQEPLKPSYEDQATHTKNGSEYGPKGVDGGEVSGESNTIESAGEKAAKDPQAMDWQHRSAAPTLPMQSVPLARSPALERTSRAKSI